MFPILLQIGPFTIFSLWAMLALGVFLSLLIISKLIKYRLYKLNFLAENSLVIFFSGLILSRIVFIIYNWAYFFNPARQEQLLEIFYIWDKGLSVWGGVLGVFISLFILARRAKEDFLSWTDLLITSISFTSIFANLGSFLDGRNYGSPTDLPWGVIIEDSQFAVPIHPVQLYASIYSLLIATLLFQLFKNKNFKESGKISNIGIGLYCLFRFLEEFMRGDEANLLFGLIREAQIYSLIGLIFSIILYYRKFYKQPHSEPQPL